MRSDESRDLSPDEFRFFHPLRVRWAELDPQGIVFNPNYFMYADLAVTEYMRAIGFPYPAGLAEFGADIFTVHASADFRAPAEFDDELRIGVRAARIGRTSLGFELGVFRDGRLLTALSLTCVIASREDRKPTPVPQLFIDRVVAFERVPPARA